MAVVVVDDVFEVGVVLIWGFGNIRISFQVSELTCRKPLPLLTVEEYENCIITRRKPLPLKSLTIKEVEKRIITGDMDSDDDASMDVSSDEPPYTERMVKPLLPGKNKTKQPRGIPNQTRRTT